MKKKCKFFEMKFVLFNVIRVFASRVTPNACYLTSEYVFILKFLKEASL